MPRISFNFNWQTAAAIVGILGSLLGGVYFIEDRYVDEAEAGQALEQYQQRSQKQIDGIELYILNSELLQYQEKVISLRSLQKLDPNNTDIAARLDIAERRLDQIQQRIDIKHKELMESGNVGN